MKNLFLFCAALLGVACARQGNIHRQGDLSIVLSPIFSEVEHGRSSSTAFSVSDEIGLYGSLIGQSLTPTGNAVNNHRFVVQADGSIKGSPTAAHYPDAKSAVQFSAYYPYTSSVQDATKLTFAVQSDQSTPTNLTLSDLCYASGAALPSASAQPLHFEHKLSRVVFNVTAPAGSTVSSLTVLDARSEVTLNLATGATTLTSTTSDLSSTSIEFILPPQTFAASRAMLSITLSDGRVYLYTPTTAVSLSCGTITSFTLTLHDNHRATLSTALRVESWTTGVLGGEISQGVNNQFTAHWLLPSPAYKSIKSAKLTVYNHLSKTHSEYTCSSLSVVDDQGPALCSYSFSFAPPIADLLSYPYRIDTVKFYDGSSVLVQQCPSLISANVYKRGAYTLGIKQDNILALSSGTVVDWGELDMSGELEGGGVNNSFRLQMIDATYAYKNITSICLTIDGKKYTFEGLSLLDGSTQFLATSSTFGFPDVLGQVPSQYPYTISSVDLYDSSKNLLDSKLTTIQVSRGGMISLQCYRGGVIALGGTLVSWGDESGSGVILGTGTKNKFTLSVLDMSYPQSAVASVRFVSDGKEYHFDGITFASGGNEFLATSKSFSTPDRGGVFPSRYPFTITRLDVLDVSGMVLQSSTGSVEVYDTRDVSLSVYRNNLSVGYGSSVGAWLSDTSTGDVSYGGSFSGNMVSLYYSDIQATNSKPCTSATKMSLTIGGKDVSIGILMQGNGSSASTTSAVNLSDALPLNNLPVRYPYAITAVRLYDSSGVELIDSKFSTSIYVGGSGSITLRVVR